MVCVESFAQNWKGEWNGLLFQEPGKRFIYRMNIDEAEGGKLVGTTYIQQEGDKGSYGTMAFTGQVEGNRLLFTETVILKEEKLSNSYFWCLKTGTLSINDYGSFWSLEGSWQARNCSPGTVLVRKNKPQAITPPSTPRAIGSIVFEKEEEAPNARTIEMHKMEIVLNGERCRLSVWDAVRVDGDKVTLMLNGKVLASRLDVPSKKEPWSMDLVLQPGVNTLVMHVDDIGTHAPNTATLSFDDGKAIHRIVLRASESSSQGLRVTVAE